MTLFKNPKPLKLVVYILLTRWHYLKLNLHGLAFCKTKPKKGTGQNEQNQRRKRNGTKQKVHNWTRHCLISESQTVAHLICLCQLHLWWLLNSHNLLRNWICLLYSHSILTFEHVVFLQFPGRPIPNMFDQFWLVMALKGFGGTLGWKVYLSWYQNLIAWITKITIF